MHHRQHVYRQLPKPSLFSCTDAGAECNDVRLRCRTAHLRHLIKCAGPLARGFAGMDSGVVGDSIRPCTSHRHQQRKSKGDSPLSGCADCGIVGNRVWCDVGHLHASQELNSELPQARWFQQPYACSGGELVKPWLRRSSCATSWKHEQKCQAGRNKQDSQHYKRSTGTPHRQ